jgi:hypothetical protein
VSKCNLDGRPIDPADQEQIDKFAEFLKMSDARRKWVANTDPEWREYLGIEKSHE